jgi:flagellin
MVTSVNASALAALLAQEQSLANRPPTAERSGDTAPTSQGPEQAVVYAGAEDGPSISAALGLGEGLNRAASISDVGISAGRAIADLVAVLRERTAAAQSSGEPEDRQSLHGDVQAALATIDQLANSASFQGVRMLAGGSGQDLTFKTDLAGATLSLASQDFTTAGPTLDLAGAGAGSSGGPGDLQALLERLDQAANRLADRLGQMETQSEQIQAHLGVVARLQDGLSGEGGGGDAEAARLQALTVQQALVGQAAAVANQAPQALLSLFRSS